MYKQWFAAVSCNVYWNNVMTFCQKRVLSQRPLIDGEPVQGIESKKQSTCTGSASFAHQFFQETSSKTLFFQPYKVNFRSWIKPSKVEDCNWLARALLFFIASCHQSNTIASLFFSNVQNV